MKRRTFGFSFVELMVVISVVAILLTIVVVNFQDAREQSRDAQRQTDLQTVSAALELYKLKYGQYPAGCNGHTSHYGSPNWSGQTGSSYACGSGNQYIVGLAPEFLPELPRDPQLNGSNSGYVYTTNDEQSVYKFMALNTVETETVAEGHIFFRCGEEYQSVDSYGDPVLSGALLGGAPLTFANYYNQTISPTHLDGEICERTPNSVSDTTYNTQYDRNSSCVASADFAQTYAVSAGFSTDDRGFSNSDLGMEYDTEVVRCS